MRKTRVLGLALALVLAPSTRADEAREAQRIGREMLRQARNELKRVYFDPTFAGRDLEALFARAEERMAGITGESQAGAVVAAALAEFADSHTYFIPPPPPFEVDFGFELRTVGDDVRVVAVDEGSSAAAAGLRVGQRVLEIEGKAAGRASLPGIEYATMTAFPRRELRMRVDEDRREVRVVPGVEPRKRRADLLLWLEEQEQRWRRRGEPAWQVRRLDDGAIAITKLRTFLLDERSFDELVDKCAAANKLVLDLRGNGGGPVEVLRRLAGVFLGEATLATLVGRGERKPLRSTRERRYPGELVVLVDAASASASEVLARSLQLAGRAAIVGDRTAGAVRVGLRGTRQAGTPIHFVLFSLSITSHDIEFADGAAGAGPAGAQGPGHSLEARGVVPDLLVLPTAADLATGRDPALAAALTKLGRETSAAQAGALGRAPAKKP